MQSSFNMAVMQFLACICDIDLPALWFGRQTFLTAWGGLFVHKNKALEQNLTPY